MRLRGVARATSARRCARLWWAHGTPTCGRARAPRHPSSCRSPRSSACLPSPAPPRPERRGRVGDRLDPPATPSPTPSATDGRRSRPTAARSSPADVLDAARRHPAQRPRVRTIGRAGRRQPHLHLGRPRDRHGTALTHHDRATCRAGLPSTCSTAADGGLRLLHARRRNPVREDVVSEPDLVTGRAHAVLAGRHPDRHVVLEPRARAATPPRSSRASSADRGLARRQPHTCAASRAPYASGCHARLDAREPEAAADVCSSTTSPAVRVHTHRVGVGVAREALAAQRRVGDRPGVGGHPGEGRDDRAPVVGAPVARDPHRRCERVGERGDRGRGRRRSPARAARPASR